MQTLSILSIPSIDNIRTRRRWQRRGQRSVVLMVASCTLCINIGCLTNVVAFSTVSSPVLTTIDENQDHDNDGIVDVPSSNKRIVGGMDSQENIYPWIAVPTGSSLCGGALIHEDIVVTAAHCGDVFDRGLSLSGIDRFNSDGVYHAVETIYPHEDFPVGAGRVTHDIMLVKLETPSTARILEYVRDTDAPYEESMVKVLGWGYTSDNGEASDVLQEAQLPVSSFKDCDYFYGKLNSTRIFCTGYEEGGIDACAGDSGGPLINAQGVLTGIVSFGFGCADALVPSVNTRISHYTDWIANGICQLSSAKPQSCFDATVATATTDNPTVASVPITPEPITSAPVTPAPVTLSPVTLSPVTLSPVTSSLVTSSPVTSSPVTSSPVTSSPVTASPITASPITASPVTASPTTSSPSTTAPTVSLTKAPTQSPSTRPTDTSTYIPTAAPSSNAPTLSPVVTFNGDVVKSLTEGVAETNDNEFLAEKNSDNRVVASRGSSSSDTIQIVVAIASLSACLVVI